MLTEYSNIETLYSSEKNMCIDHTIRCDHTISKKWTFVHTEISFHHTINIWSHRKNFDHTINFQYHTVIILITPSKFWSHRTKFVHTINFQNHTVIILFTPSRCWSHSWKFCSHCLNFDHTIYFQDHTVIILFTPLTCCSHSWNFSSHHLNFVHTLNFQDHTVMILFTPSRFYSHFGKCDRKSNAKIMNMWYKTCRHHTDFHCWYDRHTQSLKSSLCGVTELCFGTKQVRLGVITFDECKHAPWSICPSLVRQHGMDGGVFSHTVHALVQLMWHHTVALQCCPPRWWGASSSQVYIQGVCESTLNSNLCTHGVPSKS